METFKVLIVEDELIIAEDLKEILEGASYEVIGIATSWEETARALQTALPDVLLIDISIKGNVDGVQVANMIRDEISWGILLVAVPVFAARQFAGGAGAAVAGLLWAALGLVGATTALIAGHRRTAGRERQVMALGMLATAIASWPIAAEFGLVGLVLGMMLVGAAAGPIDVGALTLRQRRTDPEELGRVLSVSMSLNMSGGPLGSAIAGALVTWSLPATFAVAALASVLAAAAAVALIPGGERAENIP